MLVFPVNMALRTGYSWKLHAVELSTPEKAVESRSVSRRHAEAAGAVKKSRENRGCRARAVQMQACHLDDCEQVQASALCQHRASFLQSLARNSGARSAAVRPGLAQVPSPTSARLDLARLVPVPYHGSRLG